MKAHDESAAARLIWPGDGPGGAGYWRFHAPGDHDIRTWSLTLVGRKIQVEQGPFSGEKRVLHFERDSIDEAVEVCRRWREEKIADGWLEVAYEIHHELEGYSRWSLDPKGRPFEPLPGHTDGRSRTSVASMIHRAVPADPLETEDYNYLLELAVVHFDHDLLERAVALGADVDHCPDPMFDVTPLELALGCGNHHATCFLLARGAGYAPEPSEDLIFAHELGEALMEAIEASDSDTVQWLLDQGALPLPANWTGLLPLEEATYLGDEKIVRLLLDAGAPVDQCNCSPPIVGAVAGGHFHIVRLLLDAGCDLAEADEEGYTALGTAIAQDAWGSRLSSTESMAMIRLLLDHGANPDVALPRKAPRPRPEVADLLQARSRVED